MTKKRTFALVVVLLGVSMLTIGAGSFSATESHRDFEIYSDDNPGTFVDFVVDDRDETACSLTFEVTNNFPVPEKNIHIDDVDVTGQGFRAWASSVRNGPIGVGESAELKISVEDGHVGPGTLNVEIDMSGENVEIDLNEKTQVRCEAPEKDGNGGGDGEGGGGNTPPPNPPGQAKR